jgi:hypothetical protein
MTATQPLQPNPMVETRYSRELPIGKENKSMKRYTIPRVAHCSDGCMPKSWA